MYSYSEMNTPSNVCKLAITQCLLCVYFFILLKIEKLNQMFFKKFNLIYGLKKLEKIK